MNDPGNDAMLVAAGALPIEFEVLCPAPQLLPGESLARYHALQAAVFRDIAPQSAIEWLLAIDVAELSWEMQRYRLLRHTLLMNYRQKGVETILERIDTAGVPPASRDAARHLVTQNALDWQLDPTANREIEARLADYGFDQTAISMEVYLNAREFFCFFEDLLNSAQLRRTYLLREIYTARNVLEVQLSPSRRRPDQTRSQIRRSHCHPANGR